MEIEAIYSDINNKRHPFLNISGGHAYGSHYVMSVIVHFSFHNEVLLLLSSDDYETNIENL